MKFALIAAEKAAFPIGFMCTQLGVSRSGYYAWQGRPPSPRAVASAALGTAVAAIYTTTKGRYGSPRILRELAAQGRCTSRKRVARLMREQLCLTALTMAVHRRRPPAGLVHHSDRGSQYASQEYRAALTQHGMIASMSRRGDCWDNAVAESFWGTLKTELADDMDFVSRAEARRVLFEYIEGFYNLHRRHSAIAYRSPRDHELLYTHAATSA